MNPLITLRVPATSANLGSGFDAIGMAVSLYNIFKVMELRPEGEYEVEAHCLLYTSVAGICPAGGQVEIMENVNHPWMIGVQFHPEFLSRPVKPHPLFKDFIAAALERQKKLKKEAK